MTKFQEVATQSTEDYFRGNQFSIDAFNKKYALFNGETYTQALKRVCDYVASVEDTKELQDYWSERWFDEIYNDWWHPAGSIMQGAASGKGVSLSNCTTVDLGYIQNHQDWDNLESIIKNAAYTVAKCAAYRQGLGVEFSRLRPRGTKVENSANESTGSVHWMKFIDSIAYFVGQKGRIPAMLFSLNVSHPDIEEFITVKSDYTKIQNANISVQCTNDFYEAVEKDGNWQLCFEIPKITKGDRIYIDIHSIDKEVHRDENGQYYKIAKRDRAAESFVKTVKARKILELIAKNMWANAEPGIQNIDIARKYSNSDYVYDVNDEYDSRIISSNACCVIGTTKILTRNGYSYIKDLVDKDTEVWNGINFVQTKPFLASNSAEIVVVETSNGQKLECTPNHKWRILRDGEEVEVYTSNLSVGDVLFPYNYPVIALPKALAHAYTNGFYSGDGQKNHNSKGALLYGAKQQLIPYLSIKSTTGKVLDGNRIWVTFPDELEEKFFVPIDYSVGSKLEWLAGLIDADGCISDSSIQIASINKQFLSEIVLMLSTMGVSANLNCMHPAGTCLMPDGHGGTKEYTRQIVYRLLISSFNLKKLIDLGLKPQRVRLEALQLKSTRNVKTTITAITKTDRHEPVFCFTDPENHTGCFNALITGQSEQYLSRESLCVLASLNMGKFSITEQDYRKELAIIGPSINRFLDNVNECELRYNTYATPHQKLAIQKLRRTGAGYTNLAGWLFKNNLAYGTTQANDVVANFTKWYNYELYKSSIALGKEKGSFGLFNRQKFELSPFVQRMMALGLVFTHMRNVTCSSIAPTGTLSLMFRDEGMSYGIEPGFDLFWWKRTRISGKYEYYFCVPQAVRDFFAAADKPIPMESCTIRDTWDGRYGRKIADFILKHANEIGIQFVKATDVSPLAKLDMMAKVMKWIDSSISVTYLLPEGSKWEDVYDFILEAYRREVKSIAAFPDRKMYGIVSMIPFKDLALKLKSEGITIHHQNFSPEEMKELNLSSEEITVNTNNAPKRLKTLDCDIYHVKDKQNQDVIVVVGCQNGRPYEVFGGVNSSELDLKNKSRGIITKQKQGHYTLCVGETCYDDFAKSFLPSDQCLFRMISTMIRHGVPTQFVVEQLQKSSSTIFDMPSQIARILKKYIRQGEKVNKPCPYCNKHGLVYIDGCVTCSQCEFSKCS